MPAPKGHPPYPGCETGGRPVEWTPHEIECLRRELEEWVADEENLWLGDFSGSRMLNRDILPKLSKKCEKFCNTYKIARQIQENRLANRMLRNSGNITGAIVALKCNHKWIEGTDNSGLHDDSETPAGRSLAQTKQVCIEHANSIEQAGS